MIRLFRVFIPASVLALLVSDVVLLYFSFILGCYITLDADPMVFLLSDSGLARISLVIASLVSGIYFNDLYSRFRVRARLELIQQFCVVTGFALLVQAGISYAARDWMLPRWIMLSGCLLSLFLVVGWRLFYSMVGTRYFGTDRILYLGRSPVVDRIAARLADNPEIGFSNLGYVDDSPADDAKPGLPWLGRLEDLPRLVEETKPQRIVVGGDRRQGIPVQQLLELRFSGMQIDQAGPMYEIAFLRVSAEELRPSELVFSDYLTPPRGRTMLCALYSAVISLVAAVVLSPVLLITAILVKATSKGPILYRQRRIGLSGEPFVLYKFRSMRVDAEAGIGAVWASKNDPRVTPLGRWLRRLRLDELPQLWNVLRGEMVIVGPRPERPEFVETLSEQIPFYRQRHCVKPGITGWAQINHKYGDTLEDTLTKLEYDLYYIKHMSLSLDGYIIFHTLKVMLLSRGAQ